LGNERYFGAPTTGKEKAFFVVDQSCSKLMRLEVGSKKPLFSVFTYGADPSAPDSAAIEHHTFNMVINLKKIERHVTE